MSFVIYSKDNCRFCTRAKELLDERSLEYKEIKLDPINKTEEYDKVVSELKEKTGHYTFPFVFRDDNFIGGYRELVFKLSLEAK